MKKLIVLSISLSVFIMVSCKKEEKKAENQMPEYKLVEEIKMESGENQAKVLITEYSKDTPIEERTKFAEKLAKDKGYDKVILYSPVNKQKVKPETPEPEEKKGAIEEGYLGFFKDGKFTPPGEK